jgi:predicted DNA-binding WGR domain protein
MQKHFTCQDGKSDKFWSISTNGGSFTVRYGKTGTDGQEKTKAFGSAELCEKEAEKLVAEKLKKGYVAEDREGAGEDGDAGFRTITYGELEDWTINKDNNLLNDMIYDDFFDELEEFSEEGVRFYEGNASLDRIEVNPCTVVDGNLTVGAINWQCGRGLLVVHGTCIARGSISPTPPTLPATCMRT